MAGRFDTATIKEQVYQILRRELVRQRYEPGEWLQENEIAERLNVSRSPVREALRMLTGEGLLVEIPKKSPTAIGVLGMVLMWWVLSSSRCRRC